MPFLLIGGHAVAAHGLKRQTQDIDFLVPRSTASKWSELFKKLKYVPSQTDQRFARYAPEAIAAWPIDLMYVDDETFAKMENESFISQINSIDIKVASARHMIILKIHAMKHFQEHRFSKDYTDALGLLKKYPNALSREDLNTTCLKYASQDLYDKIINDLGMHG